LSDGQPTSSPPPGAQPLWGSYGGGSDPAPSPTPRRSFGGEPVDPLSRRLLDGAKFLSLLLILVLVNSFLNDSSGENRLEFNPVAAAAERTQNEPGARFSMKAIYTSPSLPQPLVGHGSGAINSQTGYSQAVITVDEPGKGPVRVETISDGTTMYMRGTGISDKLPSGREWFAMQPFLGHSEQEAMVGGGDVDSALQMFTAVGGNFEELGREQVRGVPTRRYRTSISLDGYAELLRDEGKDELADHYEKLATLMPGPVVGEAWIDDKEIVRRNRVVMDLPSEEGQPALTMDMRMDLFDFGARPNIQLPDSSQVFDATPYLEEQFDEIETS
jgi:hypothetical protein